jgi:glutaredoxin
MRSQANNGRKTPLSAVVYTRSGCGLCEEAIDLLRRHGLAVESIDIDRDEALRERYTNCVPVVAIDGKERFRGRINEVLLRRLLR